MAARGRPCELVRVEQGQRQPSAFRGQRRRGVVTPKRHVDKDAGDFRAAAARRQPRPEDFAGAFVRERLASGAGCSPVSHARPLLGRLLWSCFR